MPISDCHAHRYSDDAARYPVRPDPFNPPPGTGTAEHLRIEGRAAGVVAIRATRTLAYYGFDNATSATPPGQIPAWFAASARASIETYGAECCIWCSCYPSGFWTPEVIHAEHLCIFTKALMLTDEKQQMILGENVRRI